MMTAVVWSGKPNPEVQSVPIPEPAAGEVLLKIHRAGICGTDLSILAGKHPRATAPLIMGHELVGTVASIGSNGSGTAGDLDTGVNGVAGAAGAHLVPGQLVTVEPILSCGTCVACRSGVPHVCRNLRLYGIDLPGGFAQYMAVRADKLIPIPEGLPEDVAVLAEPAAVAVHAVRRSSVRIGDTVVVIGGGPIGLLIALTVQSVVGSNIIISEPAKVRRDVASDLGFTAIDPANEDITQAVMDFTAGDGADVVFEAAGSPPAVRSATTVLRPQGELVQVSIPKDLREMSLVDMTFKELTITGVRVYEPGDFQRALSLLQERPGVFRSLLSEPMSLEQAPEAFEEARSGGASLRVVFRIT